MVNSMLMWRGDLGSNPSSHTLDMSIFFKTLKRVSLYLLNLNLLFFFKGYHFLVMLVSCDYL